MEEQKPVRIEPSRGSDNSVLTLKRGLDILDLFLSDGVQLGVNEIARRLSIHKSTSSRLCATLQQSGYLGRNERTGNLHLGARVYQLVGASPVTGDLRRVARPVLHELVQSCSETAVMAVLDGLESVTIEVVDGYYTVRMQARVGNRRPAHACSSGKALLAGLVPEQAESLLSGRTLARLTSNTITDKVALLEHLQQVREQGYSVDFEEMEDRLRCIGASVRDHTGRTVAAISVSGPSDRMTSQTIANLAPLVRASADDISSRLGAPPIPQQTELPSKLTRG